jgi:hypothetical protein
MLINTFHDKVRQILEVHGGKMLAFVLDPHAAESPVQVFQLGKAAGFGQKIALANAVRQCGIVSL